MIAAQAWLAAGACCLAAAPPPAIDYNRDVRPILANYCFACHGPDDGQRQAGLRLDDLPSAMRPLESGNTAIVPSKPDQSALVMRIGAAEDDGLMPPPETNKRLSPQQKETLVAWIAAGATAAPHWSFVAPARPAIPTSPNQAWARNAIDAFVLERLEREASAAAGQPPLQVSPEADRYTLARRVYLDLVGLPPSPDEVDAFVNDPRPEAYEELVERLLASPHYGEHWARRWLDLARYADTNGYEKDRPRSVWPYRDWVIRALNEDLPFDRFTIEQIAGDLLSPSDRQAQIATGFHRNTMTNEEGGIDVEEFRFHSIVDRVNTTATVWLGLTIGCAQCHSHKFDPISQREYYQLFALLNNCDEPELAVPQPEIVAQREHIEADIRRLQADAAARLDASRLHAWTEAAAKSARRWTTVTPHSVVSTGHATLTVLDDRSVLASGDKPNQDTYVVDFATDLPRITAIRLEVLPHDSLPLSGPGRAPLFSEGDFFLGEFSLAVLGADGKATAIPLDGATHSYAADKASAHLAIDGDLDTGWSIKGRTGQAHQAVFPLEHPLDIPPGGRLRVTLEQRYIHQMTIGRFRLSVSNVEHPTASDLPAEVEQSLATPAVERSPAQLAEMKSYYLTIAPELADANEKIAKARSALPQLPTTLVMEERATDHARTTRLAHRGEFLSPRELVEPGVPAVLHPLPSDKPRNRLALAHWLVDRANPLVARVVMNRHWQYFFGRGLVRTGEDFGVRGEAPSHPELLDYLATEFVTRDWSVKAMHRLIVTSATYRQASTASPLALVRDLDNRLLARGPRLRVEAETIRDVALSAAGLLTSRVGGASVFPAQPAGVTDLAYGSAEWPTSKGADRFRRGLYTHAKRASRYPAFTTFDAPSGENCAVRRERSNTPLQALTLLNDPAFVEASQALARRIAAGAAEERQAARVLFRLCLTREPDEAELDQLCAFHRAMQAQLGARPDAAATIAGCEADAISLAAWTLTARAVLNLDETVNKQ